LINEKDFSKQPMEEITTINNEIKIDNPLPKNFLIKN